MSAGETRRHELVDVHTHETLRVRYHDADGGFVTLHAESRSRARHLNTFGQSEALLDCQGTARVFLSVSDAFALRDRLTEALAELALRRHPNELPGV